MPCKAEWLFRENTFVERYGAAGHAHSTNPGDARDGHSCWRWHRPVTFSVKTQFPLLSVARS